jgi:hypothetical protein
VVIIPTASFAQDGSTPVPPASIAGPADLSNLPDADLVVVLNPPKIVNEAMPKLLPPKDLKGVHEGLDQLKKMMAVDVQQMRYIAVALRMRKPGTDLIPMPEVLLVISGGLNGGTLTGLQMLLGPDVHTEKYGNHDLLTYTIKDVARQSEKMPFLGALSEVAATAVHDDVIVVGTPGFVRAAIDADEGRGRMNAELARSLTRDPENLITIGGSLITALSRAIALISPDRPNTCECLNRFGQMYTGVKMIDNGLRITGAVNGDNPETAGILKNVIVFLLKQAQAYAPDADSKAILAGMNISVEGSEVVGSGDISAATLTALMQKANAPSAPEHATPATTATPQTVTATPTSATPTRRTNRRRRSH